MSQPTAKELLNRLPPFRDEWITINANQDVKDIIREILAAHQEFKSYYDELALYFDGSTTQQICDNIYNFLKRNVSYVEESDSDQTTAVPAGILTRGFGDCKHYASLAGGILDALNRHGRNIDWSYRFASYSIGQRNPHHVFVVVRDGNDEIWIDPTPGSEDKYPVWQLDKKVKKSKMALRRNIGNVNGLYQPDDFQLVEGPAGEMAVESAREPYTYIPGSATDPGIEPDVYNPDTDDSKLPPELINHLQLLLDYGILDGNGNFNSAALYNLQGELDADLYQQLLDATYYLEDSSAKISGFFSNLWRGVKKVTLAAPRGAFLGLVALNVFGYATKLAQAMSTGDGFQKVRDIWYKVGGDLAKLQGSINAGKKRKRILGAQISIGVAAAAIPAWVTVAGAIITILMPVVKLILENQKRNQVPLVEGFDPSDFDGKIIPPQINTNDPMQWIQDHPLESAAIGLGLYLVISKKKIF